jgi:hypothetical protein
VTATPHAVPVAYQGDFHDFVLQHELERYQKVAARCVSELRLTFAGETARLDMLCLAPSGILIGVEIKTGDDPTFTDQQMLVYPHAIGGAGVTSPDAKIAKVGLLPDTELPAFPIVILYAEGPGLPYRFWAPKAEPFVK